VYTDATAAPYRAHTSDNQRIHGKRATSRCVSYRRMTVRVADRHDPHFPSEPTRVTQPRWQSTAAPAVSSGASQKQVRPASDYGMRAGPVSFRPPVNRQSARGKSNRYQYFRSHLQTKALMVADTDCAHPRSMPVTPTDGHYFGVPARPAPTQARTVKSHSPYHVQHFNCTLCRLTTTGRPPHRHILIFVWFCAQCILNLL